MMIFANNHLITKVIKKRSLIIFFTLVTLYFFWAIPTKAQEFPVFIQHDISSSAGDCKVVADIDLDGDQDVILGGQASLGEDLRWYSYPEINTTTSGHFIASSQIEFTTDCAAADVDGDGDIDLVAPDGPGNSFDNVLWFENPKLPAGNPSSDVWNKHTIGNSGSWSKDVHPADFDKDGLLDVAIRIDSSVKVFYQQNNGTWISSGPIGNLTGEGMGSGDVDKDGDVDLLLKGEWWENNGTRNVASWPIYSIGNANQDFKVWMEDVNGDGVNDILYSSSENTANVSWWEAQSGNVKQNNWIEHVIQANADRAHTLQTGDIDRDGDIDVIVGHMHTSSGNLYVYYNQDGAGNSWNRQQIGSGGIHNGRIADIDMDGDLDLYGANWTGNGNHAWWENDLDYSPLPLTLDSWTYSEITDVSQGISKDLVNGKQSFGLTYLDFTGDGYVDVLAGNNYFINPGGDMNGSWTKGVFNSEITTDAKLTLDVDGDQYVDVIGYGSVSNGDSNVYWMEYQNGNWNYWIIGTIGPNAHGSGQGYKVADLIPGGKPEIVLNGEKVAISEERYRINYFEIPANPEGLWIKREITSNVNSPNGYATEDGLDVGDIDGDGLIDIVSGGGDGFTVSWWKNNGDLSWTKYNLGSLNGTWTDMIEIADVDQDGRNDVLVGREDSNGQLYLFRNNGNTQSWPTSILFNGNNVASLDTSDIDLDGDLDIVLGEKEGSKRVIILENTDGFISTPNHIVGSAPNGGDNHVGTQLVDLDHDGDKDIISVGFDHPEYVHLWRNDALSGNNVAINRAPLVNAGADQVIQSPLSSLVLNATVTDDNLPENSIVTHLWTQISGPANAVIANPSNLSSMVTLPTQGAYVFRITASDSLLESSDDITLTLLPESLMPLAKVELPFNEGSGNQVFDISGNNNNGIIQGASWAQGKLGTGLVFHGSNSQDNVNLGPINLSGNQMSISAWIKPNSLNSSHDYRIVSKASGMFEQDHTWMLSTYNGNQLRLRLSTNGSTSTLISSNANLQVGEWAHVVALYDGASMSIYKNGQLLISQAKNGTITTNSNNVLIGANPNNYEVFDGIIDEVSIYESALTQDEILALMYKTDNLPPEVDNISIELDEDTSVQTTLLGSDPENDTLTYEVVDQASHGIAEITGNVLTYVPESNFAGIDQVTYRASDGTTQSNTATVSIIINPINDAPMALFTSSKLIGSSPFLVDFDANESIDIDGTISLYEWDFGDNTNDIGVVTQHNFTVEGVYTITLTVTDNLGEQNSFTNEITVLSPNNAPIAEDLDIILDEDSSQDITLIATDIDFDAITYNIESQPTHGELILINNIVSYTADGNYYGVDSFSYSASDGIDTGNTAIVSIIINPVNDLPEAIISASSQSGVAPLTIDFDASQSFDIDGDDLFYDWNFSDGDSVSGIIVSHIFDQAGDYIVTLTVSDGVGSSVNELIIHVDPFNNPPEAQNQSVAILEDEQININLLAQDPEGQSLSYSILDQPTNGTVTLNGSVANYIPSNNYNGQDSFTFLANDGQNDSNVATINITITEINDFPIAYFDALPISGAAPLLVQFDASLSHDVEDELLEYLWDFGDGSNASGKFVDHLYQNPGEYPVVLQVIDQGGLSSSIEATVNATSVNQGEIAAYDFNSSSGTVLQDLSGNNNHGLINGAVWSSGKSGNALLFDGNNDNVNIGNVNLSGNQMTISAWVYSNGFLDDDRIISKSTGQAANNHYWMISIANGNKLRFRLKTGTKTTKTLIANSATPINQWVHVVATYDGSKMKLYKDGVLVGSANITGDLATNSTEAYIGSNIGGYSPWNGKIDEVNIFNRALTQQEILSLYQQ